MGKRTSRRSNSKKSLRTKAEADLARLVVDQIGGNTKALKALLALIKEIGAGAGSGRSG